MSSVDNRVVNMQFNNQQFESGASKTLSTLDKLKKALNLDGAAKGIDQVSSSAKNLSTSGLGGIPATLENISGRFSAMGVAAMTVISNITTSAMNMAAQITRTVSIQPLIDGLGEYETQINAVQTILSNTASKGTNIDQVNAALDQLNTYADQTIYNFSEMTRNIGTFTAAGVDLNTSVDSIKGLANLAAASGSSATQASVAMYQLSQAIANGKVNLQDWNSVVNAGMGGELFQNALKRTAEHFGTNVDGMIQKYGSFRESLTKGEWLTTQVLTETLKQISGAYSEADLVAQGYTEEQARQIVELANNATDAATKVKTFTQLMDTLKEALGSGWAQSWRIIIGDFEEAKALWTDISDVLGGAITQQANARNAVLQGWKDLGGRTAIIDGLRAGFDALSSVIGVVAKAWSEVFPPATSQQLMDISNAFKSFMESLKPSETTLNNISRIAKGFFSILSLGIKTVQLVADAIGKFVGILTDNFAGGVLEAVTGVADFFTELNNGNGIFDAFESVLDSAASAFEKFIKGISGFAGSFDGVAKGLSDAARAIKDIMRSGIDKLGTLLSNINISDVINDVITGLAGAGLLAIGKKVYDVLSDLLSKLSDILGKFTEKAKDSGKSLSDVFASLSDAINSFQQSVKVGSLVLVAGAIALLTDSIQALLKLNPSEVASGVGVIGAIMAELTATMALLTKSIQGMNTAGIFKTAAAMVFVAAAVKVLAGAVKDLSSLDIEGLTKGLTGIGVILAELGVFMSKANLPKMTLRTSVGLIALAAAVKIMVSAMSDLSSFDWDGIAKGLVGLGGGLVGISVALKVISSGGQIKLADSVAILALAGACKILVGAVKDFASMDWKTIGRGLTAMGAALTEVSVAISALSKAGGRGFVASGAILVSVTSMTVLGEALKTLGDLSWDQITKGLVSMGGALAELGIALRLIPYSSIGSATSLLVGSAALVLVGENLQELSSIPLTGIGKGLIAVGGAMLIMAGGLKAMSGSLSGAAAMVVASTAIALLAPSLTILSKIPIPGIVISLVALAGVFAIIGAAGTILAPVVPAILGLSGAITLLGVAVSAVGAGLILFGGGILTIVTALKMLAEMVGESIQTVITNVSLLAETIPTVMANVGEGFVALVEAIGNGASQIAESVGRILTAILEKIIATAPLIGEAVLVLITTFANTITESAPTIIQAGITLILQFLTGIRDNIYQITVVAGEIIVNFINGIAAQLPAVIQAGFNLIISFINGLSEAVATNGPVLAEAVWNLFTTIVTTVASILLGSLGNLLSIGGQLIGALASGISSAAGSVWGAITYVGGQIISGIGGFLGNMLSKGFELVGNLGSGISGGIGAATNAIASVGSGIVGTISGFIGRFADIGGQIVSGIANGIRNGIGWVVDAASNLAHSALNAAKSALGIASPSKEFAKLGKFSDEGLANGLIEYSRLVKNAGSEVGKEAINATQDSLKNLDGMSLNPVITPVIDLSNVNKGLAAIDQGFESRTLNVASSARNAYATGAGFGQQNSMDYQQKTSDRGNIQFIQNNYSPKALSRIDIYRSTRNQISQAKEALSK